MEFVQWLSQRNGTPELLRQLEMRYPANDVLGDDMQALETIALKAWEQCGHYLMQVGRFQDAIAVFTRLYELVVVTRRENHCSRARGSSLAWMCECYRQLTQTSLAHRYLMLTLVDEAIGYKGVYPDGGGYWRARWVFGIPDQELEETCVKMSAIYQENTEAGRFPEWVLQQLGDGWKTILPSAAEASQYVISKPYAEHLFKRLKDDGNGKGLESLACYLMSSIPGCRAKKEYSPSTDYDIVCALDGPADDFRSDLGRYFLCECKNWKDPADFTTIAKFARVLESAKCKFGILFSTNGITGDPSDPKHASRELLKLYQSTDIVVIVMDQKDLQRVIAGENLVVMLRRKYEVVRLDLREQATK